MNRPLRLSSGIAVFLITSFCGAAFVGAFIYDRRMKLIPTHNLVFLGASLTIVTLLSLVGACLLIVDGVKAKPASSQAPHVGLPDALQ
jgi:hypothetical protein